MIIPYRPRWINFLVARLFGYFWLPCPICGNNFGGHEWSETLYSNYSSGFGTCPECVTECKRRNAELFATLPPPIHELGK